MRTNKLKKLALGITLASSLQVPSTKAGMEATLNKVFDDMMTNTTAPGAYETQRRGVLAGGRFTAKSQIQNANLASFTPPSISAGCNGIDMFAGSFSYINSDQIVQLFRSIAANAKGYLFQLALQQVSPTISAQLQTIQRKIQEMNQALGNSCQLAQGLVDGAFNLAAADNKQDHIEALAGSSTGVVTDFFTSLFPTDGTKTKDQIKNNAPQQYKELIGNLVWIQLNKHNAPSWFPHGSDELMEIIMTLSGTVIIRDAETDGDENPVDQIPGEAILLRAMVEGQDGASILSCEGDKDLCMAANTGIDGRKPIDIKGLKEQLLSLFRGDAGSLGIITKYAQNGEMTADEQSLLANIPPFVGMAMRNLSVMSPDSAIEFAEESSGAMALVMAFRLADDMLQAAERSLIGNRSPYAGQANNILSRSRERLLFNYEQLSKEYGDLRSIVSYYNDLIKNVQRHKYVSRNIVSSQGTRD